MGYSVGHDIERPHDLETFKDGEHFVIHLEPLTRRLPGEIGAMDSEPPLWRAVSFPLIPSERLIDLR